MFSRRTDWHRKQNPLAALLHERRSRGLNILDLTMSNPTEAGVPYPEAEILAALAHPSSLHYQPGAFGLLHARLAVLEYYASRGCPLSLSQLILTAGTGEAYAWLFMLLCEPGDNVLIPTPSYPLFDYLARMHDVELHPYRLRYDGEWHIEPDSVREAISKRTRAIVLINPHNPTGMFLKREELEHLHQLADKHRLALIVDEVFSEYGWGPDDRRVNTAAGNTPTLTFTLNGISKLCGLPQLKLGWIVVSGPDGQREEALQRLEIVADTFLSVNTPVQVALPELLNLGKRVRAQIQERVKTNHAYLAKAVPSGLPISLLQAEGGWYAILRMPRIRSEEEWAMKLLDHSGVYLYPGYFFDFPESGFLVLSLLTEPEILQNGIAEVFRVVHET